MDLENILQGENLIFYKNIQEVKALTVKANALINRSHAVYENILHADVFDRPVRGTEQLEDDHSLGQSALDGCSRCGLYHGARSYCIVHEIVKAEEEKRNARKSAAQESEKSEEPPKELPTSKRKDWENLLYERMSPERLECEYFKICGKFGVKSGRKFLIARSMAQDELQNFSTTGESMRPVNERSKQSNLKLTSITKECITKNKLDIMPCLGVPTNVKNMINFAKEQKAWRNVLKPKAKDDRVSGICREDELNVSSTTSHSGSSSSEKWCDRRFDVCHFDVKTKCSVEQKEPVDVKDCVNNYLYTVRERLRKNRLKKFKPPPEYQQISLLSSNEFPSVQSYDALIGSEILKDKAKELHRKDLKQCVESAIGTDDVNLRQNVSKLAELTSIFVTPDPKVWQQWIESFHIQEQIEEDEGVSGSGDSDISATSSDVAPSADMVNQRRPMIKRIPFVEEPLQLVDVFFDKIYTKFRKSIQKVRKGAVSDFAIPYKRLFFSYVNQFLTLDSKNSKVLDKLDLCTSPYLKSLIHKKILKSHRVKRLEDKYKGKSKVTKRRNFISGVQRGKRYRRLKKDQGFKDNERKLLEKPSPQRFSCKIVGDQSDGLLSKKNIHHHYRLLKTLFIGSTQSSDGESLMDDGMKERLHKFKRTLLSSKFQCETDTEGESMLGSNVSTRRPSKVSEKKLTSAPRRRGSRSYKDESFSALIGYGNEPSLCDEDLRNGIGSYNSSKSNLKRNNRPNLSLFEESSYNEVATNFPRPENIFNIGSNRPEILKRPLKHSQKSDNAIGRQWKEFHLPTPPLSESSCDDTDSEDGLHRVPPKEEAHLEKSSRARTRNGRTKYREGVEELELSDQSSDSYIPKLLKIPPKRSSMSQAPFNAHQSYHKTVKCRANPPYLTDSSTDTEPPAFPRIPRERLAWDRKYGKGKKIVSSSKLERQEVANFSTSHKVNYESRLPKAGPSILKKPSLPKPPTAVSEHLADISLPPKRQSFSDGSFKTTSWPSEGLVRPAVVVTERLLKSPQRNSDDHVDGSTKKISVHSRQTPEGLPSSVIGSSKRPSLNVVQSLSGKSDSVEKSFTPSSQTHPLRVDPTEESARIVTDLNQSRTESISTSSSKHASKRVNRATEVFRRRSLVPDLETPKTKSTKIDELSTSKEPSASVAAKLLKLEAIGPTKKICFNMDIGQGINCVNYLKENAPGADETKKKELVDLLITPVEAKKTPKKVAAKVRKESSSMENAIGLMQEASIQKSLSSLAIPNPTNTMKKIHDETVHEETPLRKSSFKTLDQIYKEVHGINKNNTPKQLVDHDYEYEARKRQQLTKHKISP